ncbi:Two-component response regulator ARR11 [Camellia lanceoleosa]|uniref:Two-component response regulator ARR11 n=1 Tax=Camellia lanceoleosa TaxID=1840588 RepID=A0ACC0IMQ1_9ERIC|nr:Two-component response regulator ARR11 [Camellia lanceoleosa]
METKAICILVVHDDPIYRNIMAKMLQHCSQYEDVHQSNTNGFEILHYIEKEFNLPVISMSRYKNAKLVSMDLDGGGKLHFLKSLSVNDLKTLWQCENEKERGKATSAQRAPVLDENVVEASLGDRSSFREVTRY